VVLHNRNGFWALVYIVKVHVRQALNHELVIDFRYEIQPNRTADFKRIRLPRHDAENADRIEKDTQ
jgi:hypothetical protein